MSEYKKLKGRPKIKKIKAVGENELKIIWTEVEGADKYAVLRRDEPDGEFVRIKWRKKTSFKDTVEPYKTYWYKISAFKKLEGKKKSKTKESGTRVAIISDIESVQNLSAEAKKKSIIVTWDKDPKAVAYMVSRKNAYYSQTLPIKRVKKPSFTDKDIVSGQVYKYCVQSIYKDGEKEKFGVFSKKVRGVCLDCGKILDYSTFGRRTEFSLRIVAGADGYILERGESVDGEFIEVARTDSNLELSVRDKAPSHFRTYFYRVRSFKTVKDETVYSRASGCVTVKTK